jgi:choice-of-anchor B domain-containing protein
MLKIKTILWFIFCSVAVFAQNSLNVTLLGQASTDDIRYSGTWSYVGADGTEYALIGAKSGLAAFNIDNPSDMPLLGWILGPETNWREITVLGDYAFVTTDVSDTGHSMQVVDLSFLPDSLHLVTSYTETFTKGHIIQKDVFNNTPYVYISGTSTTQGVHILDVVDPENPVEIGLYQPGYYIHDCHVRGDLLFACAFNNAQVDIVDISDKTNPTLIGLITYAGDNTHSCFTSDDGNYLFLADELDGLPARVFDISDLQNPVEVAQYSANLTSLVHNPYIRGDFSFISHNTEGLRVVDMADPELPVEVGFYDTWDGASGGFSGLWSACPFFPSGKIIGGNNTEAARIYGRVFDLETGEDLPSSLVNLTTLDTILTADFNGNFKYGMLAGDYNLTVNDGNYLPFSLDFELAEGDSIWLNIGLEKPVSTIFKNKNLPQLQISPNPMQDFSMIDLTDLNAEMVQVFDVKGALIREIQIENTDSFILKKENLVAGIYLIFVVSEKERVAQGKLIID